MLTLQTRSLNDNVKYAMGSTIVAFCTRRFVPIPSLASSLLWNRLTLSFVSFFFFQVGPLGPDLHAHVPRVPGDPSQHLFAGVVLYAFPLSFSPRVFRCGQCALTDRPTDGFFLLAPWPVISYQITSTGFVGRTYLSNLG